MVYSLFTLRDFRYLNHAKLGTRLPSKIVANVYPVLTLIGLIEIVFNLLQATNSLLGAQENILNDNKNKINYKINQSLK
jgi:hypothetical protein